MRSPVKRRITVKAVLGGVTHLCNIKQSCLFIAKCKDLRLGNLSKRALVIHQSLERCEIFNSREGLFSREEEGVARVYKFVLQGINM